MSPIGRVFIVLNLVLAGVFAWFAGTNLQRQFDYKQELTNVKEAHDKEIQNLNADNQRLEKERAAFEVQVTRVDAQLTSTKNQLNLAQDENKALNQKLTSLEASVKSLDATAQAGNTAAKAAFEKSEAAFERAIAATDERNDAVRAKDAAEAENRELKTMVATLQGTIEGKDADIDKLNSNLSEQQMLVAIATERGFLPGLAAPELTGMVLHAANNRICTVKINANPGEVDIADMLKKRKFSFALFDAAGYKGEATATTYYPDENAILCTITFVKEGQTIATGDTASTKTGS